MGKTVLGICLLVVGILLAIGGALTAVTFGPSGSLRTSSTPLKTTADGYAIVADVVGVSAGFPGSSLLGTPTLGADSTGTERLFVGIGSRTDVDEYLAGASFEAVRQDGTDWQSLTVPGSKEPGVPTDETFWIKRATGNEPTVDFATSNGNATFVVMKADGSPEVRATILIGYTSRWVFPLSLAALVVGVLMVVEGLVLLLRRRRPEEEPPPESPSPLPVATASAAPIADSSGAPEPGAPDDAAAGQVDPDQLPQDWYRKPDQS